MNRIGACRIGWLYTKPCYYTMKLAVYLIFSIKGLPEYLVIKKSAAHTN